MFSVVVLMASMIGLYDKLCQVISSTGSEGDALDVVLLDYH